MKIIKKIHDFFLIIPIYLRGLVVFIGLVLISFIVNKTIGRIDYWDTDIGQKQKMEITKMANEIQNNTENSSLLEQIEVNNNNNTVEGNVKENTKAKKNEKINAFNDLNGDIVFGSMQNPITIIEYSSYSCPHCEEFYSNTMDSLMTNYINTGKVKYVKRMIIKQNSLLGVMLPYCINNNENRYRLIGELYKKSNLWLGNNKKSEKALKEIALNNGFTEKDFYDCVRNKKLAQGLINKQDAEMKDINIFFTPTIFLDGKMIGGNMLYEELSKKIDEALKTLNK